MTALITAFWSGVCACLALVALTHGGASLYDPVMGGVALACSAVAFWAARFALFSASRACAIGETPSVEAVNTKSGGGEE